MVCCSLRFRHVLGRKISTERERRAAAPGVDLQLPNIGKRFRKHWTKYLGPAAKAIVDWKHVCRKFRYSFPLAALISFIILSLN
jgi:hypothetical protein